MLAVETPRHVIAMYEESAELGEPRAVFRGLDLRGQEFCGQALLCSEWVDCALENCRFRDCDLRGASFTASTLRHAVFERCAMYGCDLPLDSTIRTVDCCFQL